MTINVTQHPGQVIPSFVQPIVHEVPLPAAPRASGW
jgi:hypothetical protein